MPITDLTSKIQLVIRKVMPEDKTPWHRPTGSCEVMPPKDCYDVSYGADGDIRISLNPIGVTDFILGIYPCLTVFETGEIVHYEDGVFKAGGETFIKEWLENFFGGNKEIPLDVGLISNVLDMIKRKTLIHVNEFDQDKDIINMRNGLYNLRTREFTEHWSTNDYYPSRVQVPIWYDPEADCPLIKKSFGAVFYDKDLEKWLEFIAYCLYNGYPIQKAVILYSEGENGKSFVMGILRNFLGPENCSEVPLQKIANNTFASADLYGKLLNGCGDLDGSMIKQTGDLKKLISGLDPMRAEKKNQQPFHFINRAKMLFSTNILPMVNDLTPAFFRRFEIILTEKFKKGDDKRLGLPSEEDIQNRLDEEMAGLFNWVIPRLAPLLKTGKFTNQTPLEEITKMYTSASNPVLAFINTQLVETAVEHGDNGMPQSAKIAKSEVYARFEKFCADNHVHQILDNTSFWIKMHKLIPKLETRSGRVGRNQVQCLYGYELRI